MKTERKRHLAVNYQGGTWPLCWVEDGIFPPARYMITNDRKKVTCARCKVHDTKSVRGK